jgi:hypothetical protein
MGHLLLCLLVFDGTWLKIGEKGQIYLKDDHIAREVDAVFDFDKITWSGKYEEPLATGKGTLKCFQGKRLILYYKGKVDKGLFNDKKAVMTVVGSKLKWKYAGEMVQGIRQGEGRMDWVPVNYNFGTKLSVYYDGEWANNEFNGQGIYVQRYEKFEGGFKNGRYHGEGKLYERLNRTRGLDGDNSDATLKVGAQGSYFKLKQEGVWELGKFVGEK